MNVHLTPLTLQCFNGKLRADGVCVLSLETTQCNCKSPVRPSACGCWVILKLKSHFWYILSTKIKVLSFQIHTASPYGTYQCLESGFRSHVNCVSERNESVSASLRELQFVYDWTALISCLCPPAGSQAVTIDSMSCEVISSSHLAAHAARQKDDCTV